MSKFNFQRILAESDATKQRVAKAMINTAQKYSTDAFARSAYGGQPWREVQRRIPGFPAYMYPKTKGLSRRTSPILVRTGKLRREVSKLARNANIRYTKYSFSVKMALDLSTVPYGKFINSGTPNMVKRQFMGDTPILRRLIKAAMKKETDKLWRA